MSSVKKANACSQDAAIGLEPRRANRNAQALAGRMLRPGAKVLC